MRNVGYTNAKRKSKTFGEIQLKYISVGDLSFFVELLDKQVLRKAVRKTNDYKKFIEGNPFF